MLEKELDNSKAEVNRLDNEVKGDLSSVPIAWDDIIESLISSYMSVHRVKMIFQ